MEFLAELWLPILLSAVGVFVVSSIIHMATPMHKSDYAKLDDEEGTCKGLRDSGVKPGMYMFPAADSMKEMGTPEYLAKCERGPVGYMIIHPSEMWNIGKSLGQWFVHSIVVSIFTAYVLEFSLAPGTDFGTVMRLGGTIATMGYAHGVVPDSIWKGVSWGVTFRFIIDGLLYGITTGAIFAWLWPELI